MTDPDESLDEMLSRARQKAKERRERLDQQLTTARDDWDLVEVGVNGHGEVVEVAINTTLARRVNSSQLAEAVLQAARQAQSDAKSAGQGQEATLLARPDKR